MTGRFLISYDHEVPEHRQAVLNLCALLRAEDLDVRIDADVEGERVDWAIWMTHEIEMADRVLIVVSSRYRKRFMREGSLGDGRGVEIEAKIIREEIVADPDGSLRKFVPVLLPGHSVADIPKLLQPRAAAHWTVSELTARGVHDLVQLLRRPLGGLNPAPTTRTRARETVGALWLSATGGSPKAVREAMALFTAGDQAAATTCVGELGGGALRTGTPHDIVVQLLRITRALSPKLADLHRRGELPEITIGGHVDQGPAAAAAGAQWMAAGRAAARLHTVPRIRAVVAISADLHAVMSAQSLVPAAVLAAYREFRRDGDDGVSVHLSAPGLSLCPDLPKEGDAAPQRVHPVRNTVRGHHNYVNSTHIDNRIDNSDTYYVGVGGKIVVLGEHA